MKTLTLKHCFILAIAIPLLAYTYNQCIFLKNNTVTISSTSIHKSNKNDILEKSIANEEKFKKTHDINTSNITD